jgi:general secretion pathway protein D
VAGASGGFAAGVTSDATIPVTTVDMSTGTTTSTDIPAVSSIIQALATDTDANVLSTPSIMTLDNEEAKIVVGQNIPVPSGQSQSSSGLSTFDVEREDVGIELTVTPQISGDDIVRLNIEQNVDSVISTDPNWGATLDTKSVTTVVLAKNKQTIVIGGLIDDQMTVTTQKVPFLGDIPVLGSLFKTKVTQKDKTNLVVFITPYIIRERKDYMAVLKKKLEERNKFIDMNYGTSQRKKIREAIQNHAADLLEFRCVTAPDDDPCLSTPTNQAYSSSETTSTTSITSSSPETNSYDPPRKTRYKQ